MTKIFCDHCGERIPLAPQTGRLFTLAEKEGEEITEMKTPWTVIIKVERGPGFELCQRCLDDVMERAFRLFMEVRSPKKSC